MIGYWHIIALALIGVGFVFGWFGHAAYLNVYWRRKMDRLYPEKNW